MVILQILYRESLLIEEQKEAVFQFRGPIHVTALPLFTCHRKNGPGKNGPARSILDKKWSSRIIFGHPNLVQPEQIWQPKMDRANQKWSDLENR